MEEEQQAPQAPQDQGASPEKIVQVVGEGLLAFGKLLEGMPELQDKVAELISGFEAIIQEVSGGQQSQPPQGAPATMNQAGNPNATPV